MVRRYLDSYSLGGHVGWHHLPRCWLQPSPLRYQSHTHAAPVCGARVHAELSIDRAHSPEKQPLEGLIEDDVEERVDAAVRVSHADGYVVGVGERLARLLHPEVDQLEDVVRGPADEEGQADGHCHPGHLPGAHPQTARRQRRHAGGHVLEDLEEHQADDGQRYGERQEELVEREPVYVSDGVGQKEGAGHQAV